MGIIFKFIQFCIVFSYINGVWLNAQTLENKTVQQGFDIIFNRNLGNCVTCHTVKSSFNNAAVNHEKQGNFAPDLSDVGNKYSRSELTQWVKDARQIRPQTLMPPYGSLDMITLPNQNITLLTKEQISLVVDALITLKKY